MQAVADLVNQTLAHPPDAIQAAFTSLFPEDIGRRLRATATEDGHYFLPVPPRLPAYVRCYPPDQKDLVLATYVGGREENQELPSQDVTPVTTIFSTQIAAALLEDNASNAEEVVQAKENWLEKVGALRVRVQQDEEGNVSGFMIEQPNPADEEAANAQLMAFAATALYTTLLKKNINANFRQVMRKFVRARQVNPADIIEEIPELPPEEAQQVANIVNTSTDTAEEDLGTDRETALTTAHIRVRVRDRSNGGALSEVRVGLIIPAGSTVQCTNCPQFTGTDGEATLRLSHVPTDTPVRVTVRAVLQGFRPASIRQRIVALGKVTADIELVRPGGGGPGTGSGGGTE
jgi:hypothetical protein